jgi:hypothetical protein
MNTICLNMIVKNESHVIVKTLENLCNHIHFSYWVISDTGSTDNTKELIIDFFKNKQIDGELVEHDWVDFGYNRTKALECAYNKTDYLFIFDADDEIVGTFVLPEIYDSDNYTCKFGTDFVYYRSILINNKKKWYFKGVLHEYLENIDTVYGKKNIDGDYHIISGRTGNRNKNPNKYIDDAKILKKAYFDNYETDYALACRYAFYCAQSYKDAGSNYIDDAIEWYKKCLNLNMWIQEKYYSSLKIGDLYMKKNDNQNALKYWYKTIEYDNERIEGIINAMHFLRNDGQHLLVNALYYRFKNYKLKLYDKLFVSKYQYNDLLEYQNSISAYYVNDKITGYECCKKILINNKIQDNLLKSTLSNLKHYNNFIDQDSEENILELFYALDKIIYSMFLKNETIDDSVLNIWLRIFEKGLPSISNIKSLHLLPL